MSLERIAKTRRAGRKPAHVTVYVGRCHVAGPMDVQVTGDPSTMDWRPLVGCAVSVIEIGDQGPLCGKTVDAIEAVIPACIDIGCAVGVFAHPQRERIVRRHWECVQ